MSETPPPVGYPPRLQRIEVRGLFDRYNYDLDFPLAGESDGRLALLSGDNGSGKTTILRLVWHLLSSADNRGHRSALCRAPFRSITLDLARSIQISAVRPDYGAQRVEITVTSGLNDPIQAMFELGRGSSSARAARNRMAHSYTDDYGRLVGDPKTAGLDAEFVNLVSQDRLVAFLSGLAIDPIYMADDRTIHSDSEDLARSRENLIRRNEAAEAVQRDPWTNAGIDLRLMVERAGEVLRSMMFGAQNTGSASANSIYQNVVRELARDDEQLSLAVEDAAPDASDLVQLIESISEHSVRLAEHGLVPPFDSDPFKESLLQITDPSRLALAEKIVRPYFDSIQARYEALAPAEELVRALIGLINDFLVDKQMVFEPRHGLTIVHSDTGERIQADRLSSGERQLTLLLSTTLLARLESRLFIIDEPELSLGAEWQRRILGSLLKLTGDTGVQFLVATHSVEMMGAEFGSLVPLKRSSNAD